MRLDVESLRAFRAVVDCGSITKAASQLNLTQSAVSWKMKRLEERLGSPLFLRDGRDLALTELGIELLVHAEQIVTAHDDAVDSLQRSQLEGTVRLGINDELEADEVASLLARFRRRHPMVRLRVRMGLSGPIAQLVSGGDLDLALIQVLEPKSRDEVLWVEELRWIASPTYAPDMSEALPLVTFGPNSNYRNLMVDALRSSDIDHYIAFESESSAGVRSAVAAGFGVALINERGVTSECPSWEVPGLRVALPTASFVVRVNSRSRTTAVRTLVDEIHASLRVDA
ncbi:MAG: LysR substrate-binding domain-containing protein [Ilumatobacter sp.]|uniref:LysR family transcriptional regulator n=1 Tax=Ilumatobacter sp. TaxID=1967498 RepID=UPI00329726CB